MNARHRLFWGRTSLRGRVSLAGPGLFSGRTSLRGLVALAGPGLFSARTSLRGRACYPLITALSMKGILYKEKELVTASYALVPVPSKKVLGKTTNILDNSHSC